MTPQEKTVKDIIQGHSDWIGVVSGKELARLAGLENTQQLRKIIHSLRVQGEPICSNNSGYWMAQTDEELMASSRQIERFALSVLSAARGMRSKLVNQISIDGDTHV